MPNTIKLLFLAGSSRKESLNKKLAKFAAKVASEHDEVEAKFIDLADYDMPIYNGDYEEENGLPENAKKLKQEFRESAGFFLACPEYNSSITPLLKNSIDWISRPHEDNEPGLVAFKGKVSALVAASPGALGGLRGLVTVRSILGNIGVTVTPSQIAVSKAHEAFDDNGDLTNGRYRSSLENVVKEFVETAKKIA